MVDEIKKDPADNTNAVPGVENIDAKWKNIAAETRSSKSYEKEFVQRMGAAVERKLRETYPQWASSDIEFRAKCMVSQMALESRSGDSALSNSRGIVDERTGKLMFPHNYGGIKKGDNWGDKPVVLKASKEQDGSKTISSDFRVYASDEDYVADYIKVLEKPRYHQAGRDIDQSKSIFEFAHHLAASGYCDDTPGAYATNVASRSSRLFPSMEGSSGIAAQTYYAKTDEDGTPEQKAEKLKDYAAKQMRDSEVPFEDKIALLLFIMIFSLMPQEMQQSIQPMLSSLLGGRDHGGEGGFPNLGGSGASGHGHAGIIGGSSQNYSQLKMPEYKPGEGAGEYVARCAKSFVGMNARTGGAVANWALEPAGLANSGEAWCAAYSSKLLEGLHVTDYPTLALDIARQAEVRGCFNKGVENLDKVHVGDQVVFSRGGNSGMGHVETIVEIVRDSHNTVKGLRVVGGNEGGGRGEVVESYKSVEQLSRGGYLKYLGAADIKGMAAANHVDLQKQLEEHYCPTQKITQQASANAEKPAADKKESASVDQTHIQAVLEEYNRQQRKEAPDAAIHPRSLADQRPKAAEVGKQTPVSLPA